jgi:opacity protein-like surface antigen
MRRGGTNTLSGCLLAFVVASTPVRAEQPASSQQYGWSGFYIGAHIGGGLELTDVADPFGPSIYGDTVRSPGPLAGGQAGYNWQFGQALLGVEADVSWADLYGTNTCFAFSGFYISGNCSSDVGVLGTLAGRLGWLLGADRGTLIYAKAGVAWQHSDVDATTGSGAGYPGTTAEGVRWGWMLGAGAERALSGNLSLKAEYDYLSFGSDGLTTPPSGFQSVPSGDPLALTPVASTATGVAQDAHLLKIGLNYRLGGKQTAPDAWSEPAPAIEPISGTTLEIGARYVYGWGRFQKDLGIPGMGLASLASRLTYGGNETNGAEMFARLDTASGWMAKGFVGKGNGNGKLNDEDWGIPFATFIPNSNTISKVDDHIRYGVVDVGYDVWRDRRFRAAPFLGYSIFHQYMQGFGCTQIANPNSDCGTPIPTTVFVISEDDIWQAMRLGAVVDFQIAPGLTLSADAAYLPYVHMRGTDDHVLRTLLSPEWANGTGAQLELILSYAVTDQLSVGVGGRYWTMWTSDGWVNFGGTGTLVPMRYAVEQAAVLVQGSYKFTDPPQ